MKHSKYRTIEFFVINILISTAFLLIYSNGTSPLTEYFGKDSAFYMLVGKSMKNGMLPYRDLFEHKGPYFLLLQMFAQVISEGKVGTFILQVLNLFLCLVIIDKIFLVSKRIEYKHIFCIKFIFLFVLAVLFREGNLTEEFSLPIILFSLYIFVCYLEELDSNSSLNTIYGFILGISFSVLSLIRITNTAFVCSVVLTITLILIKNKNYKNLFGNILAFVAGMIVGLIPALIYTIKTNIFFDTVNTVFVFAFKYATKTPLLQKITNLLKLKSFIYIIIIIYPIPLAMISKDKKTEKCLLAYISGIVTFVATFVGRNYIHYYVLGLPNLLFAFYLIILDRDYFKEKLKNKCVICIIGLIFVIQSYYFANVTIKNCLQIADYSISEKKSNYYEDIYSEYFDLVKYIPDNEKDKVWGWGTNSRLYLQTDLYPCIKYFDYLYQYTAYEDLRNDMINLLLEKKPLWIIASNSLAIPDYLTPVFSTYCQYYSTDNYTLYKLSN